MYGDAATQYKAESSRSWGTALSVLSGTNLAASGVLAATSIADEQERTLWLGLSCAALAASIISGVAAWYFYSESDQAYEGLHRGSQSPNTSADRIRDIERQLLETMTSTVSR